MLGSIIRQISEIAYKHPFVPERKPRAGAFGKLKIALVADYLTALSLAQECSIVLLTPSNYRQVLKEWRPDLLFVESAFHGVRDEWRYRLTRQPFYFRLSQDSAIRGLAELARDRNIPACFWNKDDSSFFSAFIDIARLFTHVFTTDAACLPRYRRKLPSDSTAQVLAMPYQPAFHNFTGFHFEIRGACFVGSYYRKFFQKRRNFLEMLFQKANAHALPVHIYDRNSRRISHFFEFRFPTDRGLQIHPGVAYPDTAKLFKAHSISINVNSIMNSPTMYSRRLLEIIACGGICVTNRTPSVENHFADFCHMISNEEEAAETLQRLSYGPQPQDMEKAAAGAEHVASRHTWRHRLEQLGNTLNF